MPHRIISAVAGIAAFPFIFSGCALAVTPSVTVKKIEVLSPSSKTAISKNVQSENEPEFDPPVILFSESVELKKLDQSSIITPVMISRRTGKFDFMTKCLIMRTPLIKSPVSIFVAKEKSGFSDDYEPCTKISSPLIFDVNGDGINDLLFVTKILDSTRKSYQLVDVYLVKNNLEICYSLPASNLFIPERPERTGETVSEDYLRKIAKNNISKLKLIKCADQ